MLTILENGEKYKIKHFQIDNGLAVTMAIV